MDILKLKSAATSDSHGINMPATNDEDSTMQDEINVNADEDRQPRPCLDEVEGGMGVQGDEQTEMDPRFELDDDRPAMEDNLVLLFPSR